MRPAVLDRPDGTRLAVQETGPATAAAALVLHGTGSSADLVLRAFGPAVCSAGMRLVTYDLRGHGASTAVTDPARLTPQAHLEDLDAVATECGARIVGGVSFGAHLAATWATGRDLDGLLVALPAWTGAPDDLARANAHQADELDRIGIPGALDRIRRAAPGWVSDELAAAWPRHDPRAFCAVLRAVAVAPAPDAALLRDVTAPAGLAAFADDPMHPLAAAAAWTSALPTAVLHLVTQQQVARDRSALGAAAVAAWQEARLSGPR